MRGLGAVGGLTCGSSLHSDARSNSWTDSAEKTIPPIQPRCFMMPSVTGTGWTVICLLLWKPVAAQSGDLRCSVVGPGGALHPVQGLLERFEAGPGCAARGHGKKETHIISVGKVTNPENKVTVLLKPLSLTPSPIRPLHLLLSSKRPVTWWLEAERLPPSLPVLVQVSSNSSVQSHSLRFRVQMLRLLPFRPRALLRWALKHHGNISSLTHATYGNRVYIGLGEDPTLPAVCQLQPLFLSHNYMTSDLQPQEVQGCVHAAAGAISPEVHVIKLHSAGSGLCGSLQVEVVVSLVPPVDHSKPQRVVLILSSSMPVNWAISARGVQGDVSVHGSSDQVAAVTLRDPACQAQSNGSHFLLVFPVISCGTDGLLLGQSRGVQYKNMVLLWRDEPQTIPALNETEKKSKRPLSIHLSCVAAVSSSANDTDETNSPQTGLTPWVSRSPEANPELSHLPTPRHRSGPVLLLKLFVTKSYEQRPIGPCVIAADQRIYVEISAQGPLTEVVELKSCVVSPLSDPKKSPFWFVIKEGCSSDPALSLSGARTEEEEEEEEEGVEGKGTVGETGDTDEGRSYHRDGRAERRQEEPRGMTESDTNMGEEREMPLLRFSFVLRSVFKDSMQFVHCSLRLCDSTRDESTRETVKNDCLGRLRIPALVSKSPGHKCDIRNLSRPVVVTQSMSSLAPKAPRPPVGQRTKRLSLAPVASPDPEDISSVVQTGPVIGIVFLAFMMGVGLMGAVWCIYNSTGVCLNLNKQTLSSSLNLSEPVFNLGGTGWKDPSGHHFMLNRKLKRTLLCGFLFVCLLKGGVQHHLEGTKGV
ncbi:transforming growth factor beta receptor type 3 isoform X3 [Channa argus]|uniref:transforming growth factor beta receptor type 3 isoform X3 n=1 Tax=Channa argus TaxID=215402 RepID=UPI00352128F0